MILKDIDQEKNVFLPYIYEYYVQIFKSLTEYMNDDISQNIQFGDKFIFKFDFLKIVENDIIDKFINNKIIICSKNDLHYTKMRELY